MKPVFNNHNTVVVTVIAVTVVIFIIARLNSVTLYSTSTVNHNFKVCPLAMCHIFAATAICRKDIDIFIFYFPCGLLAVISLVWLLSHS
jgi:hypothetical protein